MDISHIIKATHTKGISFDGCFQSYQTTIHAAKEISRLLEKTLYFKGKNIGIYIQNSIDYINVYFGLMHTKKHTIVPIYRKLMTKHELETELEICDIYTVITNNESYSDFYAAMCESNRYVLVINISDNCTNVINPNQQPPSYEVYDLDAELLLQSSGTTSNPKKIMHSFERILKNMQLHSNAAGITSDENTLIQIPMTFSYCNTAQMLSHIYHNANIFIGKSFSPQSFVEQVLENNITNTILVPSQLVSLSSSPFLERLNSSKLKKIFYGGSLLSTDILNKLLESCPNIDFINTYGQTEAGPRISINLNNRKNQKLGSAGIPLENIQIKILDDNKNAVSGIGNIYVKTPCAMLGYYKNKKLTKQTIVQGWIDTGDIGYIDQDGYLFVVGRKKNIIISGGINIYPEEIESVLLEYVGIKKAYVYGHPNHILGEVPRADIECESDNINVADVMAYCKKHLAPYKIPYYIKIKKIDETLNGKIKRQQ